jgi:hypothetical protein
LEAEERHPKPFLLVDQTPGFRRNDELSTDNDATEHQADHEQRKRKLED